jgi:hypothetical protein
MKRLEDSQKFQQQATMEHMDRVYGPGSGPRGRDCSSGWSTVSCGGLSPTWPWSPQVLSTVLLSIYAGQRGFNGRRQRLADDLGIKVAKVIPDAPQKLFVRYA